MSVKRTAVEVGITHISGLNNGSQEPVRHLKIQESVCFVFRNPGKITGKTVSGIASGRASLESPFPRLYPLHRTSECSIDFSGGKDVLPDLEPGK